MTPHREREVEREVAFRFLFSPDDGSNSSFHQTLKTAGEALDKAGLNGQVLDLVTGRIVLGRGSGYFGMGSALMLGLDQKGVL